MGPSSLDRQPAYMKQPFEFPKKSTSSSSSSSSSSSTSSTKLKTLKREPSNKNVFLLTTSKITRNFPFGGKAKNERNDHNTNDSNDHNTEEQPIITIQSENLPCGGDKRTAQTELTHLAKKNVKSKKSSEQIITNRMLTTEQKSSSSTPTKTGSEDACSMPNDSASVRRSTRIKIESPTEQNEEYKINIDGIWAICEIPCDDIGASGNYAIKPITKYFNDQEVLKNIGFCTKEGLLQLIEKVPSFWDHFFRAGEFMISYKELLKDIHLRILDKSHQDKITLWLFFCVRLVKANFGSQFVEDAKEEIESIINSTFIKDFSKSEAKKECGANFNLDICSVEEEQYPQQSTTHKISIQNLNSQLSSQLKKSLLQSELKKSLLENEQKRSLLEKELNNSLLENEELKKILLKNDELKKSLRENEQKNSLLGKEFKNSLFQGELKKNLRENEKLKKARSENEEKKRLLQSQLKENFPKNDERRRILLENDQLKMRLFENEPLRKPLVTEYNKRIYNFLSLKNKAIEFILKESQIVCESVSDGKKNYEVARDNYYEIVQNISRELLFCEGNLYTNILSQDLVQKPEPEPIANYKRHLNQLADFVLDSILDEKINFEQRCALIKFWLDIASYSLNTLKNYTASAAIGGVFSNEMIEQLLNISPNHTKEYRELKNQLESLGSSPQYVRIQMEKLYDSTELYIPYLDFYEKRINHLEDKMFKDIPPDEDHKYYNMGKLISISKEMEDCLKGQQRFSIYNNHKVFYTTDLTKLLNKHPETTEETQVARQMLAKKALDQSQNKKYKKT